MPGYCVMGKYRRPKNKAAELVTATEIAALVYCPEQWRLANGLGLKPTNNAALDAGTRHHAKKALAERIAGGLIAIGRWVVLLAILALLVLWVLSR